MKGIAAEMKALYHDGWKVEVKLYLMPAAVPDIPEYYSGVTT